MTRILIAAIAGLGIGGVAGFFGYKKTLTDKAIKFKERIARVKEIEEEQRREEDHIDW